MLNEFSLGELFALAVASVAILWLLGATMHMLLRDRGLGVIGNSLLLVAGGGAGFYLKILLFGPILG